ncbi:uncharacterized protein LOC143281049 [Babylonia areolata]|uniref:uncharacterized protein LOC143281049 n=1 Tax=Babylonia areolata TaxID=304850 RepID=UPI003FD38CAA
MVYITYDRLKLIQLFLIIASGASGLISGLLFGKVENHFRKNCLLYANVSFRLSSSSVNEKTDVYVEPGSLWGKAEVCHLVTFEGVLVFIVSFVWLWFYLTMNWSRESEVHGETRTAMFTIPPILSNIVLCFLSIIRVAYATDGYQHFCFSLCSVRNGIPCHDARDGCLKLQDYHWMFLSSQHVKPTVFAFHDAMEAALVMSWLEPLMLAICVLVILAQLFLYSGTDVSETATGCSPCNSSFGTSFCRNPDTGIVSGLEFRRDLDCARGSGQWAHTPFSSATGQPAAKAYQQRSPSSVWSDSFLVRAAKLSQDRKITPSLSPGEKVSVHSAGEPEETAKTESGKGSSSGHRKTSKATVFSTSESQFLLRKRASNTE